MNRLTRKDRRQRLLWHTVFAWLAGEVTLAIGATIGYAQRFIRDDDISGAPEAATMFVIALAPMMLLACFGLILPVTLAVQAVSRGAWPRVINVAIASVLLPPIAFWLSVRLGRGGHLDWIWIMLSGAFAVAGIIVGAGAQARGEVLFDLGDGIP